MICHGNFGTVWEGMLTGKPLLCLPVHMEQYIATLQLVRLGVAIQPEVGASAGTLRSAILIVRATKLPGCRRAHRLEIRHHDAKAQLEQLVDASAVGLD